MADRTAVTQDPQKGFIDITDVLTELNAAGIELPRLGNPLPWEDQWKCLWQLVNAFTWAMSLGVYKESDTTYRVRGGSYVWGDTVKTYTQAAAVDPTDNDTTYIWMNPDNTVGAAVDGTGWPVTEHIKLASITVDADGVITAITDLRGQAFMAGALNVLVSGGASVEALPVHWASPSPADNDEIRIPIYANNDAAEKVEVARITIAVTDVSNGTEDATISVSQMVAGVLTSLGSLVGASATQALTNKTIDGDLNTVQDLPLTAIKTDAGNASKFLARDGSGVPVNGKAVPAGDVVGTSDTQALTNKTIDGDLNTVQDLGPGALKVVTSYAGVPFVLKATLAAGNTVQIYNANAPFKFEIYWAWAVAKGTDAGTWKLTNGTNDITDAAAVDASDKTISYVSTIDDAYNQIAANGSLNVVGDGSLADVDVYISCVRVA